MEAKIVLKLEQRSAKQIKVIFGLKKERKNLVKSILEKNNANYGHKWTDEQKKNASIKHKGKACSEITKQKLSKLYKGKKRPECNSWLKCSQIEKEVRIKKWQQTMSTIEYDSNCFKNKTPEQKKQITDKMSFSQRDRWNHMDAQTYEEEKLKKKYAAAKSHLNYQLRKLLLLMIISRVF